MHIVKDENGNVCSHAHNHEHPHVHSYEHTHEHDHAHGHEEDHAHGHVHTHSHETEDSATACPDGCSGCDHKTADKELNKNAALLNYMLQHNKSHALELDQVAKKLNQEGMEQAAEQIRKAVDEFEKGNMYLSLALSLVGEEK